MTLAPGRRPSGLPRLLPSPLRRAARQGREALAALAARLRSGEPAGRARRRDPSAERVEALDRRVAGGDRAAARLRLDETTGRAGSPAAVGRAAALELLAADLPEAEATVERAVIAHLRDRPRPRATAGRGPDGTAREARSSARRLRDAGHAEPRIVITLPALEGNPYTELMEEAYEPTGVAALHVDNLEDAAAAIAERRAGGYDTVLHINASNRLVWGAKEPAAAMAASRDALARIDGWRSAGVPLVVTVHDGPILGPDQAAAEQALAQGIADRAAAIHVLTASTPRILEGWLRLDPARIAHIPHPSYDGVYPPPPPRAEARAALGLAPSRDAGEVVLGMIGLLSSRKGPRQLVEALAAIPDPLPDGRSLRLLLAGRVVDTDGEGLIRAANADPRIITRFGVVPDAEMSGLLAALDVAVVPYRRYLNSGWTVLALGAGIPVVAPAGSTAEEVVPPEALLTFRPDEPDGLARALERAPSLVTPLARAAARRSVADLDAHAISQRFSRLLRDLPLDA